MFQPWKARTYAPIIARKERNLRTRCIGCNSKNEGDKAGLQLMVRALSDVSDSLC